MRSPSLNAKLSGVSSGLTNTPLAKHLARRVAECGDQTPPRPSPCQRRHISWPARVCNIVRRGADQYHAPHAAQSPPDNEPAQVHKPTPLGHVCYCAQNIDGAGTAREHAQLERHCATLPAHGECARRLAWISLRYQPRFLGCKPTHRRAHTARMSSLRRWQHASHCARA